MRTMRMRGWSAAAVATALLLSACGGDEPTAEPEEDAPATDDGDTATTDEETETSPDDAEEGDDEAAAGDDTPIRVAYLQTGSSAPMFLTADKYAEEAGVTLEMTRVSSGNESLTGVATGQFDVGFAGIGSGAYNAVADGLPVRFVAPMHAGYLEDYFIISSTLADSQEAAADLAEDMSDLADESYAVNAPGVVTEALLGQALERVGLNFADVNLEYIPFPDQVPALANGGVAAAISSEPFPTQAENNGAGYRPWETPDEPPATFTGILFNTDWAEANPELAEGYLEAYSMAAADLAENGWDSDDALGVVEEYTGADPEVLREARQHHIPADLTVDFDALAEYQQFYLEQGSLNYDEVVPEEELWDFSWRDAVLQE